MKNLLVLAILVSTALLTACGGDDPKDEQEDIDTSTYTGTGFITQGLAETVTANLLECGRVGGIGTIKDTQGNSWTVPAEVNYTNASFPFASVLNNACSMANYTTSEEALSKLDGSDIIEIDATGELITAYIFADNYFEMYVNGVPVGKDRVPYTQFNSDLVRFKVSRPFTVAMLLVDWEENLGLGSEDNHGFAYQAGDGGMVAVFKNESGDIIGVTGEDWKAQTYYTAPIKDLSCLSENGTQRNSSNCDESGSNDGTSYYGIHWTLPSDWSGKSFDDSSWPSATLYTNSEIGVDNKPAFTNFTDLFDDPTNDAEFIWSTNVVLDNLVLVRGTID